MDEKYNFGEIIQENKKLRDLLWEIKFQNNKWSISVMVCSSEFKSKHSCSVCEFNMLSPLSIGKILKLK